MPERKFIYMDSNGMRRTLVWDEEDPTWFGVFPEANMENLARLNREQAERESALHATTTLARIPYTQWEIAHHEGWSEKDWTKFLNDSEFRDYRVWSGKL